MERILQSSHFIHFGYNYCFPLMKYEMIKNHMVKHYCINEFHGNEQFKLMCKGEIFKRN